MSAPQRQKRRRLDPSLLMMVGLLAAVTLAVVVTDGANGLGDGLRSSGRLFERALPFLILGLGLAGMLQVLVPARVVGRWMGDEAGTWGLVVGIAVGSVTPGGPFILFPIAAALINSGAGVGPMAGYVTSRNLLSFNRLIVWELPFLGVPFTVARIIVSLAMPIVAVVVVPPLYRLLARLGVPVGVVRSPATRRDES